MYLMTELILFIPLIIYACIRVRKLIPGSTLKNTFVFLIIFLFFGYPIAELLSHREISGWILYVVIVGYYCLPYLLYFTLSVVAIDIAVILLRSLKLLRREVIASAGFRSVRLICYLIIPAMIVYAGALNNNRLRIKEYSLELPRKSSTINKLNIIFASDFHLGQVTKDRLLERFVDKVNALQPDIILIGGDILEGHGNESLSTFEAQFRRLKANYGVYAVPGNHERYRGGSSPGFFDRSGMKLLEDDTAKIDGSFYLVGRKDSRSSRKPILDLLKDAPEDLPIILLDHRPTDLESVSKSRVDLQLSGHTHNGQLFPVNLLVMPFQYELAWGVKVKRSTQFIVSSGVQAWGPPVKTAGDSEILFINVTFQPEQKPTALPNIGLHFPRQYDLSSRQSRPDAR